MSRCDNTHVTMDAYCIAIVTYNRLTLLKECFTCIDELTVTPEKIVVVNNASTDGTTEYLQSIVDQRKDVVVINLDTNVGGAGGFAASMEYILDLANSNKICSKSVLLMDDDVMLHPTYAEELLIHKGKYKDYYAFAGQVMVAEGNDKELEDASVLNQNVVQKLKIDTYHRARINKLGLYARHCLLHEYDKEFFACEFASFCGLLIDIDLIKKIGVPHAEYFIWHDDYEYSMRMLPYTKVLVIPKAKLWHKTNNYDYEYPRKYDWREYYAIRNRLLYLKEHGNILDYLINCVDILVNIRFRNWYFALIHKNNYDWKYEKEIVKRARIDAKKRNFENPRIIRES